MLVHVFFKMYCQYWNLGRFDIAIQISGFLRKIRSSGHAWLPFCKVTISWGWEAAAPQTRASCTPFPHGPHLAHHFLNMEVDEHQFASHHRGRSDDSLQQCWTESEVFLVNSSSVWRPKIIRLKGLRVWRNTRKEHYYDCCCYYRYSCVVLLLLLLSWQRWKRTCGFHSQSVSV